MLARSTQLTSFAFALAALVLYAFGSCASAEASGTPVPGFGNGGIAYAQLSAHPDSEFPNHANDAIVDRSGRILLAGARTVRNRRLDVKDFTVVAFDQQGKRDRSWGRNGVVIEHFPKRAYIRTRESYATTIAQGADGRIYVGGLVDYVSDRDITDGYDTEGDDGGELNINRLYYVVFAYDSRGRRIKSFGDNGKLLVRSVADSWRLDSPTRMFDLSVAPDGSIYIFGEDDSWRYKVLRLSSRGRPVRSFGERGTMRFQWPKAADNEGAEGAELFADSSGVTVTYATTFYTRKSTRASWSATRLTKRGVVDRSWGSKGRFRKTWPLRTAVDLPVHVEQDYAGNLVFAGTLTIRGPVEGREQTVDNMGAVLRLSSSGILDKAFGIDGVFQPKNPDGSAKPVLAFAPTAGGGYVFGTALCPLSTDDNGEPIRACAQAFSTEELNLDGAPLPSWGIGGLGALPGKFDQIIRMMATPDRIYAAFGEAWPPPKESPVFGVAALTR